MPACALGLAYHAVGFTWIHRVCQSFRCHSQNVKDGNGNFRSWNELQRNSLPARCPEDGAGAAERSRSRRVANRGPLSVGNARGNSGARLGDARAGTSRHRVSGWHSNSASHRYRQLQRGAEGLESLRAKPFPELHKLFGFALHEA